MNTATFDLVVNDPAQTVVGKATLPAEFPGEPAFIKTPDGKVFQANAGYGPTTYVEVSVYDVPASDYQSA